MNHLMHDQLVAQMHRDRLAEADRLRPARRLMRARAAVRRAVRAEQHARVALASLTARLAG